MSSKYSKEYKCIGGLYHGTWQKIDKAIGLGYVPFNRAHRQIWLSYKRRDSVAISKCALVYVDSDGVRGER